MLLSLLAACSTKTVHDGAVASNGTLLANADVATPEKTADPETRYVLQPGDVLLISAWKEPDLQAEVVIRPDGGLSFPLAGELMAGGRSVEQLRSALTERIQRYVPDVLITVVVKLAQGHRFYVVGKVTRPGEFVAGREVDVMQAIGMAGGTTPFAALNKIKVLRRESGRQTAIPFRYGDVEDGEDLQQNIVLRSGDVVVVP
ncbi:MAG TPA: polysaccharide biosynthesis/export family protein [Burkholderiales bacterium]|nr:polysaccharide biosynthesis/export family protein [Burkholderiales bacterium]